MNLYHYYDKRSGPFKSLTALEVCENKRIRIAHYLEQLSKDGCSFLFLDEYYACVVYYVHVVKAKGDN